MSAFTGLFLVILDGESDYVCTEIIKSEAWISPTGILHIHALLRLRHLPNGMIGWAMQRMPAEYVSRALKLLHVKINSLLLEGVFIADSTGIETDRYEDVTVVLEETKRREFRKLHVIPNAIDPALRRPGRFDKLLLVPAPDEEARLEIFKVHTKNMPLDESVDLQKLVKQTNGYAGADIEGVCREAAMLAIRESLVEGNLETKKVSIGHFAEAMKKIRPSYMR